MADSASEDGVFFRSVAHRSEGSGLSAAASGAADLLDASGFSWILVETVGTGQADSAALRGASLKVLVHTPDSGDEVQMLKAGIVETADLHVVTKCDRPGARAWASELEATLGQGPSGRGRVFPVSSVTGEGVDELVAELIEVFNRSRDGAGNVKS
jgi:LAO/AO transport system kinase